MKKAAKIVLLVVLLAMVGVIVYAVMAMGISTQLHSREAMLWPRKLPRV